MASNFSPPIVTQNGNIISITNPSKTSETIRIYNAKVPIKAGKNLEHKETINLENFITDFKSIKNSDFGYDSTFPHFLDFLEKKTSKWDFLYRQLFPEDKNRETMITKIIKKNKKQGNFRKRRTNRQIKESLRRIRNGYQEFLNAYPHNNKVRIIVLSRIHNKFILIFTDIY